MPPMVTGKNVRTWFAHGQDRASMHSQASGAPEGGWYLLIYGFLTIAPNVGVGQTL
jgi:hypothetical protein